MLTAFGVENYRSFKSAASIEIRPITILLGKNSSGKSSLTRFIPLLQQSLDRRTASPILWNSDIIDFGDISNVRSHGTSQSQPVKVTLEVDAGDYHRWIVSNSPFIYSVPEEFRLTGSFKLTASLREADKRTVYERLDVHFSDLNISIQFGNANVKSITYDGATVPEFGPPEETYADLTKLFPSILFRRPAEGVRRERQAYRFDASPRTREITDAYSYFVNKKTSQERRSINMNRLVFVPIESMQNYLGNQDNIVSSRLGHSSERRRLHKAIFLQSFNQILSYCESKVRPTIEASSYSGPSRASGARYYRYQELSVDRIDSRGENLPMYLSSLSTNKLSAFNRLLEQASGYVVRVRQEFGHASIEIAESGSNDYENLADVGFGFSQLLPVIAQIHATHENNAPNNRASISRIIAIEQPELHLHPAMQAKLGDLFASAIRADSLSPRRGASTRFLLETHSEALIARFGELVASGKLSPEEIILYFIEKEDFERGSQVKVGGYRPDGSISNWPLGFFSAGL